MAEKPKSSPPPQKVNRRTGETDPSFEQEEVDAAAAEAAMVGGRGGGDGCPPAQRAVREAGGGYAEGFEEAEAMLIEHASHADQQSAHAVLHDRGRPEERLDGWAEGEADHQRSTEITDAERPEAR
jgi:hypothetical protein